MPDFQSAVDSNNAPPSGADGDSRAHRGGATACPTPTNRGHANPSANILRFGVDSLFLSFEGELNLRSQMELEKLKLIAQDDSQKPNGCPQMKIGKHVFEVTDKGSRGFSFCLVDNAFFIKLSKNTAASSARKMPMAYVQISSEYLTHVGVNEAFMDIRFVMRRLGELKGQEKISRVDLFADFTTDFDFSSLQSCDLVCRAKHFRRYEEVPDFTGISFGLGGEIGFRLYDKTRELRNNPRPYLLDLWEQNGWQKSQTVWRAEYEVKRKALKPFDINTVDYFSKITPSLWEYLSSYWLRMIYRNLAETHRERLDTHAVWKALNRAFSAEPVAPLKRNFDFSRVPKDNFIFKNGFAGLTSFMAREGFDDPVEGIQTMMAFGDDFHKETSHGRSDLSEYIQRKVEEKRVRFNKEVGGVAQDA